MASQCNFDKRARLRAIQADIETLQAKTKQNSTVPAGLTYAEVFSAAINAAMRHKRAMVGTLSRKSDDDSPAEMTFEEIMAYERVTDDYIRPSTISLQPPSASTSRLQPRPSRHDMLKRQSSIITSAPAPDPLLALPSETAPPSAAAAGSLARQSSSSIVGAAALQHPHPSSATDPDAATPAPEGAQEGVGRQPRASHSKLGFPGGFTKPSSPTVISYGYQAVSEQGQGGGGKDAGADKDRGQGPGSPLAREASSPIHAQHTRLLQSQAGPGEVAPRASLAGWGKQYGLGAMAWTGECMSPGTRSRVDHALLELWSLDVEDKEHGTYSRPYTAPSALRGANRYSSRTNSPQRTQDGTSPQRGSTPARGNSPPKPAIWSAQSVPATAPLAAAHSPAASGHALQPDVPASPDGDSPNQRHSQPQQLAWGEETSSRSGVKTPAEAAGTGDPRTWPFASMAAQGGSGGVDAILEGVEEGDLVEEEGCVAEKVFTERQKPGLYRIMRRAPHQITTATMPYLMGLPLEMLASMEEIPCLAGVVASKIWHPPLDALHCAEHQELCQQAELAVALHKQRQAQAQAEAAAAAAAAEQRQHDPRGFETHTWHNYGTNSHAGAPPDPEKGDSFGGQGGRLLDIQPESIPPVYHYSSEGPKAGNEKGRKKWARSIIKRPKDAGKGSHIGFEMVMRGLRSTPDPPAGSQEGGEARAGGMQEQEQHPKLQRAQTAAGGPRSMQAKGSMKPLPQAPGSARPPSGLPSLRKKPLLRNRTLHCARQSPPAEQQQPVVPDKPIHAPGLLTQKQQAQRQRQLAQHQYTLRQQHLEAEGLRMEQQRVEQEGLRMEQQRLEGQWQQQGQQLPQGNVGPNAPDLQPQERQEMLQAARERKQAREDKLRQGVLYSAKAANRFPMMNQLVHCAPPSPSVRQIKVLDSLMPSRNARNPMVVSEPLGSADNAQD